jgi:P27 family predicted phage terminase small subunit
MPAGRPPKPTHLKLIEGNPGKRPLNAANEVQPLGSPTAPKIMTKRAKAIWTRLLKVMPARVWTGADSNALANYCEAQARYEEMTLALLEGAPTFETNYAGQSVVSGTVKGQNEQARLVATLGARLGLDPVARRALAQIEPDKPKASKFDWD